MRNALLLNADYTPLGVVNWQRAICLVMEGKVRRVVDYANLSVRSPSLSVDLPAVVSLPRYISGAQGAMKLSRRTILARDQFTCQYCGLRLSSRVGSPLEQLTIDHVVPRSAAVRGQVRTAAGVWVPVHDWANVVTACKPCNHRKGARTPSGAGMPLRSVPARPGTMDAVRILFSRVEIAEEWEPYLPAGTRGRSRETGGRKS